MFCHLAFTLRFKHILQLLQANSANIKLTEVTGLRLLVAVPNYFMQKITFLRWFVACYFAFVNTLMQFFRGGLRYAYRKPQQYRPENFNGSSGVNYNPYFTLQHFYLIATLPLFFASYLSEFFF